MKGTERDRSDGLHGLGGDQAEDTVFESIESYVIVEQMV